MGSERRYNVASNELLNYIDIPKRIDDDIDFVFITRSKTKSPYGFYEWQSTYIVHGADTIDGLFLHLKAIRYQEFDYYNFRLFYRYQEHVNNIHQLEVYPDWKNSHTEPNGKKLYGSHIHTITQVQEVRPTGHERFDWYSWLDYYIQQTKITLMGKITAPTSGELF